MGSCEFCDGTACKCDKPIRVSFCPECKSRNVKYVFSVGNLFGIIPKMKCGKCGNEGAVFPLLVTNKKLLAKSAKSRVKKKSGGKKK